MFGERRLIEYPDGVLEEGTFYGLPERIWDSLTAQQKEATATLFALAMPELAIGAGAQDALAHGGSMSLKAENLTRKL